jgi:Putative peptidoglycan binding domain
MGRLMTEGEIQVSEQKLKDFGFDPGTVDGVFTAQTKAALRTFRSGEGYRYQTPSMPLPGVSFSGALIHRVAPLPVASKARLCMMLAAVGERTGAVDCDARPEVPRVSINDRLSQCLADCWLRYRA